MPYVDPADQLAWRRRYYAEHRDEIVAKAAAWRAANLERAREKCRAYFESHRREQLAKSAIRYAADREAQQAIRRDYRAGHKDEINAKRREKYAQDPERIRRQAEASRDRHRTVVTARDAARGANSRAAVRGIQGRLSTEDVLEVWRREPVCVDCGQGYGLDHVIPFARGGTNTTGNLTNRCRGCNLRKGKKLPEEMAA